MLRTAFPITPAAEDSCITLGRHGMMLTSCNETLSNGCCLSRFAIRCSTRARLMHFESAHGNGACVYRAIGSLLPMLFIVIRSICINFFVVGVGSAVFFSTVMVLLLILLCHLVFLHDQ